jgi:flavin reductase (DIM6/NTAB) family NADH-FMN oxidoreductase RutF
MEGAMDIKTARKVLEKLHTGVFIVTAHQEDEDSGMAASWVSQVSFAPPMVMVAIGKNRFTHELVSTERAFAVNILGKDGAQLVKDFAASGPVSKLEGTPHSRKETGAPILDAAIAFLECKLANTVDVGDHTIFVGEVVNAGLVKDEEPILVTELGMKYKGFTGPS